jgi:chorismate mutase/prephenate dehydratase
MTTVVAYQGTEGAWGHIAARRYFGARGAAAEFRAFDTFRDALEAVRGGRAQAAVLPIENTTAGSINEAYDLLAEMDLAITGEEIQRIDHCLMAPGPTPVAQVTRILSHPQAIAQCAAFLRTLTGCHVEAFANTALAARKVRDDGDPRQAAIGSEEAARAWGLTVIARGITDERDNYTRFVVVGPRLEPCDAPVPAKTSLVFTTRHERGALVACLAVLARTGHNLLKIESRPMRGSPFEYLFYVDFEGNIAEPATAAALAELKSHTVSMKVLGCYPVSARP